MYDNTENKRKNRFIDKELGKRYRGWEQMPNETFSDFKKRLRSVDPNFGMKYPAWKKMPNESDKEFKRRFSSKRTKAF